MRDKICTFESCLWLNSFLACVVSSKIKGEGEVGGGGGVEGKKKEWNKKIIEALDSFSSPFFSLRLLRWLTVFTLFCCQLVS